MANITKFQRVINAAEDTINADAESVRAELASARQSLPALRETARDVQDGLSAEAEVKTRLKKGEDVPAMELVVARAEDEIAAYRLNTAEARIGALSKRLPASSTLLADKIAPAFTPLLPGVEIITTTAPLSTWRNDVPEGTTAVVLSVAEVVQDPSFQTYSGTVRAYYVRSGLMRPLSVASLEAAHRSTKPDCHMEIKSSQVGDEGGWVSVGATNEGNQSDPTSLVLDTLVISVAGVIDGLPVIGKTGIHGGLVKTWTMHVFGGFLRPGVVTTARIMDMPDISEHEAFVVKYGMSSIARGTHPKVTEEIHGNERTLTLRQKINLQGVDLVAFAKEMHEGAQGYVNGSYLDLGILTSATATPRLEGGVMHGNHVVEVVCVFKSLTA